MEGLEDWRINNHCWVFAAVASDLGFKITVRDTRPIEGADVKVYRNEYEPGNVPPGVADVGAFRC